MLKHILYTVFLAFAIAVTSCNQTIKPEQLYGKWKYTKVEHPNADPPTSLRPEDLKAQSPYIQFSGSNQFTIFWGGKVLSHGTFTTIGQNIMITEQMPGGDKRNFSFQVSELTAIDLVFETKGDDGSRVTAVKF